MNKIILVIYISVVLLIVVLFVIYLKVSNNDIDAYSVIKDKIKSIININYEKSIIQEQSIDSSRKINTLGLSPEDLFTGYRVSSSTGNESILFDVQINGLDVCLIPKFATNKEIEESYIDADNKTVQKNVTYTQPDSINVRGLSEFAQVINKVSGKLCITLPIGVPTIRFGESTITLTGESTYNSTNVNIQQETGFVHLNISTTAPYNSLVGYWSFDRDNASKAYDYTTNNNDGIYINGSVSNSSSGLYNDGAYFDGVNKYIDLSGSASNLIFNAPATFSIWMKPNFNRSSSGGLYSISDGNPLLAADSELIWITYGEVSGTVANESILILRSTGVGANTTVYGVNDNANYKDQWTHVVVVFGASTWTVYVNGVLKTLTQAENTFTANSQLYGDSFSPKSKTSIGSILRNINSGYFNGSLDEVMIFNTSLNSSQISEIYNNQSARFSNTGTMNFSFLDFGVNNTANITISGLEAILGSNVSAQINGGNISNFTINSSGSGNLFNYNVSGNLTAANMTITLYSSNRSSQFYTPIVAGNITLISWLTQTGETIKPNVTFIRTVPSEINATNLLNNNLIITYNISDETALNISTISLYHKTNDTNSDAWRYINGTLLTGYNTTILSTLNQSNTWNFTLALDDVYPGTHNLAGSILHNTAHTNLVLDNSLDIVKVILYNVSSNKDNNYLIFNAENTTSGAPPLDIWYCNESYSTGTLSGTSSCGEIFSFPVAQGSTFNVTSNSSKYHALKITPSGGNIAGVKVTAKSQIAFQSDIVVVDTWTIGQIGTVAAADTVQTSSDGGTIYANNAGTVDLFLLQYNNNHTFYHYACANDTSNNQNCSTVSSDLIGGGVSDTTPPVVTINFPANTSYSTLPLLFNVSLNEQGSIIKYSLDAGLTNVSMSSSDNINYNASNNSIADGSYTFRVYANDSSGNRNDTAAVTFFFQSSLVSNCKNLTLPGVTYTLSQSFTASPIVCIGINANNITFDGQGFRMQRDGNSGSIGILSSGTRNITIMNTNISSFGTAIQMTNVNNSRIVNNTLSSNTNGLALITSSQRNTIANNTIESNKRGVWISGSSNNTIESNNISYNTNDDFIGSGIYLEQTSLNADYNLIRFNVLYNNSGKAGIYSSVSYNNTISENNITFNHPYGIFLEESQDNSVISNRIGNSTEYNLYLLDTADRNNISRNSINGALRGIQIESAMSNSISHNYISNATNISVHLSAASFNVLYNLTIDRTIGDAIRLSDETSDNNNISLVRVTGTSGGRDIAFANEGINDTYIIDTPLNAYSFDGLGGTVHFLNSTVTELRYLRPINESGNNLSLDIILRRNYTFINASRVGINRSANITFYGMAGNFNNPVIFRDGIICTSCYNFTSLNATTVIFNVSGGGTYTISQTTDTTNPSITSLTEEPDDPATYLPGTKYQFNATITDTNLQTVRIEFNNVNYTVSNPIGNVYNFTISNLGAGTYNYYWRANDTANNLNITPVQTYTVNKATGVVYTFINQSRAGITVTQNTSLSLNGTLITGTFGSLNLTIETTQLNFSSSSNLTYIYNFTSLGTFSINTNYSGDQNYTSEIESWTVTVSNPATPSNATTTSVSTPRCKRRQFGYLNERLPFLKEINCI